MTHQRRFLIVLSILVLGGAASFAANAQWINRYKKLDDFGHHTYLEQHELPILSHGPVDPAPGPDGRRLAFAAQGWIWLLDLETAVATRISDGAAVDARPRWSPDGKRLAFVRDTGKDTSVVVLDLESRREQIIGSPAIELDPEFSADGAYVFYTSGESGSLELHRHHLVSGTDEVLTALRQVVRNARRLPEGAGLLYLHGSGAHRVLRERQFLSGEDRIAHGETLAYHLSADVHPDRRLIVFSAPIDNDYHLWTMDLDDPRVRHRLTEGAPYATLPAFSADGESVFYAELGTDRQFRLMRIPTHGGVPRPVTVQRWDYGTDTGSLQLALRDGAGNPLTGRVSIRAASGHPVAFHEDATYFDPQTGRHYFYVEGSTQLTLPKGRYIVEIARGPMVPVQRKTVQVRGGVGESLAVTLEAVWNAGEAGYVSADYHVHLNGDGHHRASHEHALRAMAGEDLDHLAPQSWNRWERRIDRDLLGRRTSRGGRTVMQAQEVRSHFHGHVGVLGASEPYAPWFFGPGNPTLGNPDLTNGDVFAFAERNGAFATYVHPVVGDADPFADLEGNRIPLELVSDALLVDRVGFELICAWTSPLGNAQVWYRLLNVGRPVAAMSGTDSWVDFHRTPAPGTARNYVRIGEGAADVDSVLAAAAQGYGFLSTGPALLFRIGDGIAPGEVTGAGEQPWRVTLASTTAVDTLELVVNGRMVQRFEGVAAGESRTVEGQLTLPAAGWVAARAYATQPGQDTWPTMHARPFAHSSPIWIGEVGSSDPAARAAAAADLARAIDASSARAREAYGDRPMPRLHARFDSARAWLAEVAPEVVGNGSGSKR